MNTKHLKKISTALAAIAAAPAPIHALRHADSVARAEGFSSAIEAIECGASALKTARKEMKGVTERARQWVASDGYECEGADENAAETAPDFSDFNEPEDFLTALVKSADALEEVRAEDVKHTYGVELADDCGSLKDLPPHLREALDAWEEDVDWREIAKGCGDPAISVVAEGTLENFSLEQKCETATDTDADHLPAPEGIDTEPRQWGLACWGAVWGLAHIAAQRSACPWTSAARQLEEHLSDDSDDDDLPSAPCEAETRRIVAERRPQLLAALEDARDIARSLPPEEDEEVGGAHVPVRLQVVPSGAAIHTGSPDFDLDHHGAWGASTIRASDDDAELEATLDVIAGEAEEDAASQWSERRLPAPFTPSAWLLGRAAAHVLALAFPEGAESAPACWRKHFTKPTE